MREIPSQEHYLIEHASLAKLKELIIEKSPVRFLHADYVSQTTDLQTIQTTYSNPAILATDRASFCALLLGVNEDGNAVLAHDHLIIEARNKIHSLKTKLESQPGGKNVVFVSGRWDAEENEIKRQNELLLSEFGSETDVVVLDEANPKEDQFLFVAPGISGIIFIPKYLAKDGSNHILYIKNDDQINIETELMTL